MRALQGVRQLRFLLVALPLILIAAVTGAPASPHTPPADVQSFSFSVARAGPATALGLRPADILVAGGIVSIACEELGLVCTDPDTNAVDDLSALSYGGDFIADGLPALHFSVKTGALGAAGSAVSAEAGCSPSQPQADAFQTEFDGSNAQDLDGDGIACAGNGGYGLTLSETPTSDDVDALERDPCQSVDLDCDGRLDNPIFFALTTDSPSLTNISATAADILAATGDFLPVVYADHSSLGLVSGDAIDALCLQENGNGALDSGDKVLISLASASPSLATLGANAGDLLSVAPLRIYRSAGQMGLAANDDLDAALCSANVVFGELYLPIIQKQ
jgi:hypothetical protein